MTEFKQNEVWFSRRFLSVCGFIYLMGSRKYYATKEYTPFSFSTVLNVWPENLTNIYMKKWLPLTEKLSDILQHVWHYIQKQWFCWRGRFNKDLTIYSLTKACHGSIRTHDYTENVFQLNSISKECDLPNTKIKKIHEGIQCTTLWSESLPTRRQINWWMYEMN